MDAELTYDQALAALQRLQERDKLSAFVTGDIIRGLVALHGPQVMKQLAADLGVTLAYIRQREAVAAAFPPGLREDLWGGEEPPPPVTWVHHRIVVQMLDEPEDMQRWIKRAIEEQLSSRQLAELIRGERPDSPDDILVSVDEKAGEVHVKLSEEVAVLVSDKAVPGVYSSVDSEGRIVSLRVTLPERCKGMKIRFRKVR